MRVSRLTISLLLVATYVLPAHSLAQKPAYLEKVLEAQSQRYSVSERAAVETVNYSRYHVTKLRLTPTSVSNVVYPQIYSGASVIEYASRFVGAVPYSARGNTPAAGFSCDGYVQYVLAHFGVSMPRGANTQAYRGYSIPASQARAGDLLWWPGQHIAFYDGHGGMLDSPMPGRMVQHRSTIWGSPVYIRLR